MKLVIITSVLIASALLSSCGAPTAQWPAQTKNPHMLLADPVSDADKNKIYNAIWAINPNTKLLSIDMLSSKEAKVSTTTQASSPITSTKHYILTKSGSTWSVK